ncbi:MAG: hypothetical protein CVV28_11710 [Methanobacteriales archaeon HGW-Methanobacteriales-1]|jgi:hypothetical protein|nr:MAG: hypothetical protein CVV28_11710 [Methanobacteriales archaeon HGW-Methanobacteriales-1]
MTIRNSYLDNQIYWTKGERGWSMVIMPESIRIDNFHGYCHIHLHEKKNYHTIKDDTFDNIYNLLVEHLERNKGIDVSELEKELE